MEESLQLKSQDSLESGQNRSAMQGREARLNAALSVAELGTFEWHLLTNQVTLDERSRQIFGFGETEGTTAREIFDRIHPDDSHRVWAAAEVSKRRLSRLHLECRIIHPSGVVRTIVSTSDAVPDTDGRAERMFGVFSDVTERKRAEEEQRQNQERLSFALDAGGGVGTWDWDVKKDCVYSDTHFAQLYSVDSEQAALGVPLSEFVKVIHPDDRERVGQCIEQAVRTGENYAAEYRLQQRDGTVRWVYARGRCHHNKDGTPTRFSGVAFDITARKQLEEESAERERRYHALLTATDQGYCLCEMVWDENGRPADYRFLELNPKFEEATGLSRALALGSTARKVVPGLEDFWIERYGAVVLRNQPDRFESQSVVMGRWFDVFAHSVGDNRFALVFSDITRRKTAEAEREQFLQQIKAEQQRLYQVFGQAPVAIAVLRGKDLIVELANPLYQRLLQGRALIGRPLADVMPELSQDVWNVFHQVLQSGEPFAAEDWHIPYDYDGDGVLEDHWFNVACTPLREPDGTISSLVAVLAEATEQVQARRELEHVNRELEEFAYIASHDLQEPLRMVNIYSQLLIKRFGDQNKDAQEYAAFVRQGVARMETLIRDLLTYSRTIQREELPVGVADLTVALQEALAVLDSRIEESGAVITTEAMPRVRGDTAQLAHVFQNLLSNALKYRKPEVRPEIHVSAILEGEHWNIAVRDNGIGFEPRYAERIFGLFKRLHKDEYPGTGLGLAICHRIVQRYGGRIWAEGNPGTGATFYLSLPQAEHV